MHTSVCRRRTWPGRIVRCLHTLVSRRRMCLPASSVAWTHRSIDVRHGLALSSVACTTRSADVKHGLPASPSTCTQRSAVQKSKEFETPFMHNNILICFPIIYSKRFCLTWFISTNLHYFYGTYDIETSFICTNVYSIISFTCLEVFSIIFIFFQLLFIFIIYFYGFLFFRSHFKN